MGVGSSNIASLVPDRQAHRGSADRQRRQGHRHPGEARRSVNNYRPYMEQLKSTGTVGLYEFEGQSIAPEIQAMKDIGWTPAIHLLHVAVLHTADGGRPPSRWARIPPTYVGLSHLPFELSDQFPILAEIKEQLTAAVANPRFTEYTAEAYSAWSLFALSATAVRRRPHVGLRPAEGRRAHRLDGRRASPRRSRPARRTASPATAGWSSGSRRAAGSTTRRSPIRTTGSTTATRRTPSR